MTGRPVGGAEATAFPVARSEARLLVPALMFIALVVAAVGSLGTPLITSVATLFHVSLGSAQWTLTVALLSGAVATPVLGRLGAGPHRRATILATPAVVVAGSALTVLPLPFAWLLAGRAAQGIGLGLTALMTGVARDHLPEERGAAVIALISDAARRRLRFRADDLRRRAGPHPVLGAGVRRRQADAAGPGPGHLFPDDSAYTTAAPAGIGAMAITTLTSLALARRRPPETNP